MQRWQNRTAVVTGASSGIGAAIVKCLLNAGMVVAAFDIKLERMEQSRCKLEDSLQERYHPVVCDVTDMESVNAAFDKVENELCGADVLVNNAGILCPGMTLTQNICELHRVVQTNFMSIIHCTQRAYKCMKVRNFDGHIVNINSILGHNVFPPPNGALPELSVYPATKYAVTALTETIRQEVRDLCTCIKVTSVSPGFVKTDIELPECCKQFSMLEPEDIAEGVLYAISTPPHVQVHELTIKPIGEMV